MIAAIQPEQKPLAIPREEMAGLTAMSAMAYGRTSLPLKIAYDNICVHKFYTGMKANPRPFFRDAMDVAKEEIDDAIDRFVSKDSAKQIGDDSWQIQNGFLTVDVCVHSYTEYDTSEYVFEDLAIHRVVVSMTVRYDAKQVYCSKNHVTDVFDGVNKFYVDLVSCLRNTYFVSP